MTDRLLILFLLIGVGYFLRKRGVVGSAGLKDIVQLNIDVLMPALVFYMTAVGLTPEAAGLEKGFSGPLLGLPLVAAAVCLGGAAMAYALLPLSGLKGKRRGTFIFLLAFANSSFLPIPLIYALRGESGMLEVILYGFGYTSLFWTFGMWVLHGRPEPRYLLHPNLIALAAGAVLGLSGTVLPQAVLEFMRLLGNSAIPIALLCVGGVLAEQGIKLASDWRPLAVMTGAKLLLVPAIALVVVKFAGLPEPLSSQAVLQAAMPCMAQAAIFVSRFGGDARLAGASSFLTTLVSALTVPFFLGMIK